MNLDSKLTIPPKVMSRLVGDETVLLNLESGLYFGLDGVGQRIWELVLEGRTLSETVAVIIAEYDVGEEQATADVLEFASTLIDRGLLTE